MDDLSDIVACDLCGNNFAPEDLFLDVLGHVCSSCLTTELKNMQPLCPICFKTEITFLDRNCGDAVSESFQEELCSKHQPKDVTS